MEAAANADAIVDDNLFAQPFAEPLRDDAADDVVAAARGERHHQSHRARRIGLRKCAVNASGSQRRHDPRNQHDATHGSPLLL